MKKLPLLLLAVSALCPGEARAASDIVISQVYGGGGNAGATLKNDFIELYNRGLAPVAITGWSVQYASAAGSTWAKTDLTGTIPPGGYYLIQEAAGAGGSPGPTPDASGTIAMSATAGKVALVNNTTLLTGTGCPFVASVVDFVGFGTTANCSEGGAPTPSLSNTTAAVRNGGGCADTDNNGADFAVASANPRNSASLPGSCVSSTPPTGIGAANPPSVLAGESSLLTVSVTPGNFPTSTGLTVSADLTAIGGAASQAFFDDGTNGDAIAGNNVFSFQAAVGAAIPVGPKTLPASVADAESRSAVATISLGVAPPPTASTTLVISQVYGGGGNSGATLKNDFIEIFNLGAAAVNVTGWSVQYASSAGTSWQVTPLSGTISGGRYYLVQEAQGAGGTVNLPTPEAIGTIAMAAGSGKVALVSSTTALSGGCPVSSSIVDFVGYGSASCSETSPTGVLSATLAAIRNGGGSIDTNNNASDFTLGAPEPRNATGRPPLGTPAATPASLSAGETTLLTVAVAAGAAPPSTGLTVQGGLTEIGGAAAQPLFDDGTNGDVLAGDHIFSFTATVPLSATFGSKSLSFLVSDAEGRSSSSLLNVIVEPPVIAIHDVQGAGLVSPLAGQLVATRGVVTARKFNGFFIQTPDTEVDANPMTSEGVFVFTSSSPSVSVGDLVKVAGTVQEFAPSADPASPPTTELAFGPTVTLLASGQPVPAPITLTAADTPPAGGFEALERFEGMRVHIATLRVVAPTGGQVNEANADSTSSGLFYGVVDGVARPFREAGIAIFDPLPTGAPCCVPRFDVNPELLRIDSDGQGGPKLEVTSNAIVSNVIGPLEFAFRAWTIAPDPTPLLASGLMTAVPVPAPSANEFTVAAANLERFFDDVDDPIGDPVLTSVAYAKRLNKASLAIRNVMRSPDILGVEEVENLSTLQTLAAKLNADAVAAGDADPQYDAHLSEGNDVGGIDSGFLVKRSRVNVVDATQVGKTATYVNPNNGASELLNDRPPLVLRAEVSGPVGLPYAVTVIVNHLRSLNGVDSTNPDGLGTQGDRVRAKRRAQAEYLANLIQARQTADPLERIVSVGDYNAFRVNDGYGDSIATIKGTPTPADQVVTASPDLVNPNLTNLGDEIPEADSYSYSFDGNAQSLDHVLVNAPAFQRFSRFHHARNDADFPESYRGDGSRPERLSDHDWPVAYFAFPGAPTLTLLGSNPMAVECPTAFTDPGATASDGDLGDLTSAIQVSGSVDCLTLGSYTLTYSVSNGFLTTTVTRTVNVVDSTPPVFTLNGASSVTLELGASFLDPGASAADACAGDRTAQIVATSNLNTNAPGNYLVTYTVSDPSGNTATATRTVSVVDSDAPEITAIAASPHVLWPPNGQLERVQIHVTASDESGTPTCAISGVSSDEPVRGHGSGPRAPDWDVTGALTLMLRAERDARGDGRTYTIAVTCRDGSGNAETGSTTVIVPKSLGDHHHHDHDGCERQPRRNRHRGGRR